MAIGFSNRNCVKENPEKLVDMDTVQGAVEQNEVSAKQKTNI